LTRGTKKGGKHQFYTIYVDLEKGPSQPLESHSRQMWTGRSRRSEWIATQYSR